MLEVSVFWGHLKHFGRDSGGKCVQLPENGEDGSEKWGKLCPTTGNQGRWEQSYEKDFKASFKGQAFLEYWRIESWVIASLKGG